MRYFLKHNDARCPREAILEDLSVHVNKYKEKEDCMVVLGYCNEDVNRETIVDYKREK